MTTTIDSNVRLFTSERSWIEGIALNQLYSVARLEGMRRAVGFPDLHPGKGSPVGAAFVVEERIYPHLIGSDVGCGMALLQTDLLRGKAKVERWAERAFDLEHPWEGDRRAFLGGRGLPSTAFDDAMGTIGGGNHFAELQAIEKVLDAREFACTGMDQGTLVLLVHSGSRGFGDQVLREHVTQHGARGVQAGSAEARKYLAQHTLALKWAAANRALIGQRFAEALGSEAHCLWDGCHNSITEVETSSGTAWVHRKGATPSDAPFAVVPGSRGSLSYVVKMLANSEDHAWSIAHGAGRKWSRSETRLRMRERFSVPELTQTPLGGRVVCEERQLLYEEAPAAYKNIEVVVQDLVEAGLVSVVATTRPLLTYKTRMMKR